METVTTTKMPEDPRTHNYKVYVSVANQVMVYLTDAIVRNGNEIVFLESEYGDEVTVSSPYLLLKLNKGN